MRKFLSSWASRLMSIFKSKSYVPLRPAIPKTSVPNYAIKSLYSEEQIVRDVGHYLGRMSRWNSRVKIITVDEQLTGADAGANWKYSTIYLQFKKPTGLRAVSDEFPLPKDEAYDNAFQKIRRLRNRKNYNQTPHSLCFQLRSQAKTAKQCQHNILFGHNKPPAMRAAYVSPTLLDYESYERGLNPGWAERWFLDPFFFRELDRSVHAVADFIESDFFLRHHATIVPHKEVNSTDHHYSFDIHGMQVLFHSPEEPDNSESLLSYLLARQIRAMYQNNDEAQDARRLAMKIYASINESPLGYELTEPSDDALDWIKNYGLLLRRSFGIEQILLAVR